jgi:hypothetical protein
MSKILSHILTVVILLSLSVDSKAGDTLRINLIHKHVLTVKGENTGKEIVIDQLFFTPDNHKLREIFYDEKSGLLSGYVFYFYRNDQLFTEEFHNAHDSLLYILKHDYDKSGNETMLTRLIPGGGHLVMEQKTIRTFTGSHQLTQVKTLYGKKAGTVTKYTYDPAGIMLTEKSTFKSIAKSPLKQESKQYSYSPSGNKIASVLTQEKDLTGKTSLLKEEYTYNDKGLLISVKQFSDNAIRMEKKYSYNINGTIIRYEEFDNEGKLTLQIHYEYLKHYMEKGTQESHYEDF